MYSVRLLVPEARSSDISFTTSSMMFALVAYVDGLNGDWGAVSGCLSRDVSLTPKKLLFQPRRPIMAAAPVTIAIEPMRKIRTPADFPGRGEPVTGFCLIRLILTMAHSPPRKDRPTAEQKTAGGIIIPDMINRNKGDFAYNIIDIDGDFPAALIERIRTIEGVVMVRFINPVAV